MTRSPTSSATRLLDFGVRAYDLPRRMHLLPTLALAWLCNAFGTSNLPRRTFAGLVALRLASAVLGYSGRHQPAGSVPRRPWPSTLLSPSCTILRDPNSPFQALTLRLILAYAAALAVADSFPGDGRSTSWLQSIHGPFTLALPCIVVVHSVKSVAPARGFPCKTSMEYRLRPLGWLMRCLRESVLGRDEALRVAPDSEEKRRRVLPATP